MANVPETKQDASVRDFLSVVFSRKYTILAIVAITTATVFFLNARQPQLWVSSSRALVKRGERTSVFSGGIRYLSWEEEMSSQIEVVMSEAVFNRATELFQDTLKARGLTKRLVFNPGSVRAAVVGESNVLSISYSGFDPDECEIGCGAIMTAYREYYRKQSAPPAVSDFFAREIQAVTEQLDTWRKKKAEFLNKENYFGLAEESRFQMGKLGNLEKALSDLEDGISSQSLRVQQLKELVGLSPSELEKKLALSVSPDQIMQSTILTHLKSSLQRSRMEREELLHKYTERHPDVIALDNQIADLQMQLQEEVQNTYNLENSKLQPMLSRQATLKKEIAETKTAIDAIPDKEMKATEIDNTIASLEKKSEQLVQKQNEAAISIASTPEWEVTILSPASKAWPRKTKDIVRLSLGPFLSLVVALGLAFFLESVDHSMKNVGEVEEYLGTTVLATVSEQKEKV
jgi:uncharacterized protein involved in exopolysaccharide biosynthesis